MQPRLAQCLTRRRSASGGCSPQRLARSTRPSSRNSAPRSQGEPSTGGLAFWWTQGSCSVRRRARCHAARGTSWSSAGARWPVRCCSRPGGSCARQGRGAGQIDRPRRRAQRGTPYRRLRDQHRAGPTLRWQVTRWRTVVTRSTSAGISRHPGEGERSRWRHSEMDRGQAITSMGHRLVTDHTEDLSISA